MGRRNPLGTGTALSIVLMVAGCRPQHESAGKGAQARPNIILVTIESLRADRCGCYGYEHDTTPTLDDLARRGVLFENAASVTSWTLTAHASVFTGLYPTAHQTNKPKSRLDDSYVTLAELLARHGYQTAGIITGPYLRAKHNLHQGFELYDESLSNTSNRTAHGDVTNTGLEARLSSFLTTERDAHRPFFLFVYAWDPHYDYIPPEPYDRAFVPEDAAPIDVRGYEVSDVVTPDISAAQLKYVISQQDGEIRCSDDMLGRFLDQLRGEGLWDETVIIVTSDHGEEFFDHGNKGHKNNLFQESIHVPLVIKPSGRRATARRDARLANLVDLFPTILSLAGASYDGVHHGYDLLSPAPSPARVSYHELVTTWYMRRPATGERWTESHEWYAVREGDLKLICVWNRNACDLYHLADDPGELRPLGILHDAQKRHLRNLLVDYRERMATLAAKWGASPPAELTPEEIERLKSLGYLGSDSDNE